MCPIILFNETYTATSNLQAIESSGQTCIILNIGYEYYELFYKLTKHY